MASYLFVLPLALLFGAPSHFSPEADLSGIPGLGDDSFAQNLSEIMGVPVSRVAPEAEAFMACVPGERGEVAAQAAAFAAGEPLASTRALLTDFARQIVVQISVERSCDGLAALWDERDPFVRTTADPGIGITESDLAAGEALERLAGGDPGRVRSRVLALWDGYDAESQPFQRLFLTRLDAWTPAVAQAWDGLDEAARHAATRATYSDTVPDAEVIERIIGTGAIIEWMGGSSFDTGTEGYERYDDLIRLTATGYFGGRPFVELTGAYRKAIDAMNASMYENVAFDLLFDLMDLNAQYNR